MISLDGKNYSFVFFPCIRNWNPKMLITFLRGHMSLIVSPELIASAPLGSSTHESRESP